MTRAATAMAMLEGRSHVLDAASNQEHTNQPMAPAATAASVLVDNPDFQELLRQALTMVVANVGQEQIAPPVEASADTVVRRVSPRQRAAALRQRMMKFRAIYNAGWQVRYYLHGDPAKRVEAAGKFCEVLTAELAQATDKEALIYAIADTITCSPYGVPWEG